MRTANTFSHRNKKGIYSVITSFFFVLVMIAVSLGVILYGNVVLAQHHKVNEELGRYLLVKSAKDRVFFCLGKTVLEERLITRELSNPSCLNVETISYSIQRFAIHNCTARTWNFSRPDAEESFPYLATIIGVDGKRCLGKLVIYLYE